MPQVWDRLAPYESDENHALFHLWVRHGGNPLAWAATAKATGMAAQDLRGIGHRFKWRERAAALEAYLAGVMLATAEARAVSHGELVGQAMQVVSRAAQAIARDQELHAAIQEKTPDFPQLDPAELTKLALRLPLAVRALRPADDEKPAAEPLDLSKLSDDELFQLRTLTEKAQTR